MSPTNRQWWIYTVAFLSLSLVVVFLSSYSIPQCSLSSVLMCLHVHHFSIFCVHADECTYDWYTSSLKQAQTRCSSILTFHARNCRLLTVIARARQQRIVVKYERESCTLLTLLTAGLIHGSTSSPRVVHRRRLALQRVHKHHTEGARALSVCVCMRVEIEAMEDDSDVVIFRSIKLNLLSSTSVNIRTAQTVSDGGEREKDDS